MEKDLENLTGHAIGRGLSRDKTGKAKYLWTKLRPFTVLRYRITKTLRLHLIIKHTLPAHQTPMPRWTTNSGKTQPDQKRCFRKPNIKATEKQKHLKILDFIAIKTTNLTQLPPSWIQILIPMVCLPRFLSPNKRVCLSTQKLQSVSVGTRKTWKR